MATPQTVYMCVHACMCVCPYMRACDVCMCVCAYVYVCMYVQHTGVHLELRLRSLARKEGRPNYLIKDGVVVSDLVDEEFVLLSRLLHHYTGGPRLLHGRFSLAGRGRGEGGREGGRE